MPEQPELAALRTALEQRLDRSNRIIDPWHEGWSESSEQAALVDLAGAARAYLALQDALPIADTPLSRALDLADSETSGIQTFSRLMLLDGAVRRHLAELGEPVRRQGD
ncbi:hypothetical protein [Streptacidiphilus albus]|uniref:hypothetical protein n=1 Tax=Streptacidiphilus albus TaxID=105425 RepID=UPI00054C6F04|nr:hypothetical protein [Streptacidiphilus albus]